MSFKSKEKKVHEKFQKLLELYTELLEALEKAGGNQVLSEKFIIEELDSVNEFETFMNDNFFSNDNFFLNQPNKLQNNVAIKPRLVIGVLFVLAIVFGVVTGILESEGKTSVAVRASKVNNNNNNIDFSSKKIKKVYEISTKLVITLYKYLYNTVFFLRIAFPQEINAFIDEILKTLNEEVEGLKKTPYKHLIKELVEFQKEYTKKFNKLRT